MKKKFLTALTFIPFAGIVVALIALDRVQLPFMQFLESRRGVYTFFGWHTLSTLFLFMKLLESNQP